MWFSTQMELEMECQTCILTLTKQSVCSFPRNPKHRWLRFLLKEKNVWLCPNLNKYLCIILDFNFTVKKHVKKEANAVRYNLANFTNIRPYLTTEAAKLFMHAMIFSQSFCNHQYLVYLIPGNALYCTYLIILLAYFSFFLFVSIFHVLFFFY